MQTLRHLITLLTVLLVAACGSDYLDINQNPNAVLRPPLDGLLAAGSYETGLNHFRVSTGHSAYFVQHLASFNQSNTVDIYDQVSNSVAWSNLYNTMTDLQDLVRFGTEAEAEAHVGIARALLAMNLGLLVDNWGSVPYSDAFTGETIRPMYDPAPELYSTIFSLLDQAEADLKGFDGIPALDGDSDFIHEGDLEAWRRTISALRARYLNHLSETSDYDPAAVLAAADNAYNSNDDNAALARFEVRNPWAQVAQNNDNLSLDGWLSDQFVSALNGTTYGVFDPRLPLLTDTTVNGDYVGTINGAGRRGDGTEALESYLELDGALSMENSPLYLVTYPELKLIEAEAALATGNQARAEEAFTAGVVAHMQLIGVDSSAAEAYVEMVYGDDPVNIDDVFREKYVALFLQPEAWVDARRYDYAYEGFELAENADLSQFPRRLQYPNSELDRNAANTPNVTLTDPLFWD